MADDDNSSTVSQFSEEEGYTYCEEEGTLVVKKKEEEEEEISGGKAKYWGQRYRLWSKYDDGILMDDESWYSVTPEEIAAHIAEKCKSVPHDIIIDAFSGSGGNAIQFAKIAKKVIAIDIDPKKLELSRHNARIYGVQDKIEYICGDYTKLLPTLEADIVFLSPPWGGPLYNLAAYFDLADIQLLTGSKTNYDGRELFEETRRFVSKNIIYFLPKNVLSDQVTRLAPPLEKVEIENNIINMKVKSVSAYFGNLAGAGRLMRQPKRLLAAFPPEYVTKKIKNDTRGKRSQPRQHQSGKQNNNDFIPSNK